MAVFQQSARLLASVALSTKWLQEARPRRAAIGPARGARAEQAAREAAAAAAAIGAEDRTVEQAVASTPHTSIEGADHAPEMVVSLVGDHW